MITNGYLAKCSRCEDLKPESELIEMGSWLLCSICLDDI
jgi:hypothetical protein